ncbi:hypothetical protein [Methanofollis ethanolicus]|uniref:hypothetical protein n=1 Tax=Methanofollis ethanolicus TaxID=488124 RepID=UPI00136602BC|nr:hypothetical protein [Methanofollis ethanolicus]
MPLCDIAALASKERSGYFAGFLLPARARARVRAIGQTPDKGVAGWVRERTLSPE